MRQVRRGREVVSFTKDCCGWQTKKSAILFPHSVATKEYTSRFIKKTKFGYLRPFCSVVQERIFLCLKK